MLFLEEIVGQIDDALFTYVVVGLLLICGIYFTIRTRFIQIRRIGDMFKYLVDKKANNGKKAMSSFQALMISTGSRVGTGNIAGIATAIIMGGPGSIFWMWVLAIIGASSAFIESTLAQIWKVKGPMGAFAGGPAFYIKQALGKKKLGGVFAVSLIFTFAIGFNALQSFNCVSSLDTYFSDMDVSMNTVHLVAGIFMTVITAITIFGGMKLIGNVSSVVVPIMAFIYIGFAFFTIFSNVNLMGQVFAQIFDNAFNIQSILSGAAGMALLYGTKRGLLSNEAGMGSAPNAAACASVSHPAKQGLIQALSAYIDTFLICTSSAFMVMIFCVKSPDVASTLNGMPLIQETLTSTLDQFGLHFITLAIFFFAFSSIIGNYVYAENNFKYLTANKKALFSFRLFCLLPVLIGSVSSLTLAWSVADIFMGVMAAINIISIMALGKWAIAALKDFDNQKRQNKDPVFKAKNIPNMPPCECWQ